MSLVLLALQLVTGAAFAAAGASKLLRADEFWAALRLSRLPEPVVFVVALALPVVEIGLSGWLFMGTAGSLSAAFLACVMLLLAFTVWMAWVLARKLTVRCGCFGGGDGYVGVHSISRNLALMAVAAIGWALAGRVTSPLGGVSLWAVIAWSTLALSVALVQAARFAIPYMTLTYDQFRNAGAAEVE